MSCTRTRLRADVASPARNAAVASQPTPINCQLSPPTTHPPTNRRFQQGLNSIPLDIAVRKPRAVVDPLVYIPPPLQATLLGWHPDVREQGQGRVAGEEGREGGRTWPWLCVQPQCHGAWAAVHPEAFHVVTA